MVVTQRERRDYAARRSGFRYAAIALTLLLVAAPCLTAQPPSEQVASDRPVSSWSLNVERGQPFAVPTLGGQVYWADELVFFDWRIQRNTFSKHCRLLDGCNRRLASGDFENCRAALERIKREQSLPAMHGKAVIVIHGLAGARLLSSSMANVLRDQGGYLACSISYPSRYEDIDSHAESLAKVIANLDGVEEINLVAHSMGNLLIRRYWAGVLSSPTPDPRIRRIVMIGPPNHGSELAARFDSNRMVARALGPAGQELGSQWAKLEPRLTTPSCEFGVIAGGSGSDRGFNPMLYGDDDGLVSVDSARLVGATDFMLTPDLHWGLMHSSLVQQSTLQFLMHGYFTSEDERRPILK